MNNELTVLIVEDDPHVLLGCQQALALEDIRSEGVNSAEQALALDDTLRQLEAVDARAAQVVELLYFAGLTLEQVAGVLDLTRRTIDRDWRFARAFLRSELG